MAGGLKRGDIRLYRFPAPDKERPVVVLTRDAAIRHLAYLTVAPITSTIRDIPTEVVLDVEDGVKRRCAINLDLVITVPKRGIGRLVATLRPSRLNETAYAIAFALGFESLLVEDAGSGV